VRTVERAGLTFRTVNAGEVAAVLVVPVDVARAVAVGDPNVSIAAVPLLVDRDPRRLVVTVPVDFERGLSRVMTVLPDNVILTTLPVTAPPSPGYSYPRDGVLFAPVSATHRNSVPPSSTKVIPWASVRPVSHDRRKTPLLS
jgi:hypothetical protein